jgi:hypothetical protein
MARKASLDRYKDRSRLLRQRQSSMVDLSKFGALRFCLSDLVIMKDVPARANLLKLRPQFFQSCLLASIHRLVIRSSLSSRSAKSVASNALI